MFDNSIIKETSPEANWNRQTDKHVYSEAVPPKIKGYRWSFGVTSKKIEILKILNSFFARNFATSLK